MLVDFDIEKVTENIDLENINKDLVNKVITIVANNYDDEAEIGRRMKLMLTRWYKSNEI